MKTIGLLILALVICIIVSFGYYNFEVSTFVAQQQDFATIILSALLTTTLYLGFILGIYFLFEKKA